MYKIFEEQFEKLRNEFLQIQILILNKGFANHMNEINLLCRKIQTAKYLSRKDPVWLKSFTKLHESCIELSFIGRSTNTVQYRPGKVSNIISLQDDNAINI